MIGLGFDGFDSKMEKCLKTRRLCKFALTRQRGMPDLNKGNGARQKNMES